MARVDYQYSLRTFRRKAGLTQRDLAFLIGARNESQISRYERGSRSANLHDALAYHVILGPPVEELFAAILISVRLASKDRLRQLQAAIALKKEKGRKLQITARKLTWISRRLAEIIASNEIINTSDARP